MGAVVKKKFCVLMGSPRENGNTAAILSPFIEEMKRSGHSVEVTARHLWTAKKRPGRYSLQRSMQDARRKNKS